MHGASLTAPSAIAPAGSGSSPRAFGHKTHFVYAERDGAITGVLPLTEIRSRLFGHALVSNAFQVYGGPVAVDDASRDALISHATAACCS